MLRPSPPASARKSGHPSSTFCPPFAARSRARKDPAHGHSAERTLPAIRALRAGSSPPGGLKSCHRYPQAWPRRSRIHFRALFCHLRDPLPANLVLFLPLPGRPPPPGLALARILPTRSICRGMSPAIHALHAFLSSFTFDSAGSMTFLPRDTSSSSLLSYSYGSKTELYLPMCWNKAYP